MNTIAWICITIFAILFCFLFFPIAIETMGMAWDEWKSMFRRIR